MTRLALTLLALSTLADSLQWRPHPDFQITGYNLYIYGPTNFIAQLEYSQTNYSVGYLPPGEYSALLTFQSYAFESGPAGPVRWTNNAGIILNIQFSPTLQTWSNILSTNIPTLSTQGFFRVEIKRK